MRPELSQRLSNGFILTIREAIHVGRVSVTLSIGRLGEPAHLADPRTPRLPGRVGFLKRPARLVLMRANYMQYFSKEIPNASVQAQIATNAKIDP